MKTLLMVMVLASSPVYAQQPVEKIPDALSYATMTINPIMGFITAMRSDHRKCELGKFFLSGGLNTGTTWTIKHFTHSPRPCEGLRDCNTDSGFPSGHTAFSGWGMSWNWKLGAVSTATTAGLRVASRQHFAWQTFAGAAIAGGFEWASSRIHCE